MACYEGKIDHPVFLALRDSAERFHLSRQNFENLLRAFESDVVVNRHPNFDSLLAYCTCSANPVGRLVLELFGYHDPHLFELSDNICTALQLTNFWQDVAIDFSRDRVYLPQEDMARFNYTLDDLRAGRSDTRWQELLAFEIARTRELFERGRGLPEEVQPKLRTQLRLTWLGGTEILSKIEAVSYDIFHRRPSLSKWDFLRLYLRARRAPLSASVAPRSDGYHPIMNVPSKNTHFTNARVTNFYYAFVFLPPEKRLAIEAVYAFARRGDDVADSGLDPAEAAAGSGALSAGAGGVLRGRFQPPRLRRSCALWRKPSSDSRFPASLSRT